MFTYDMPLFRPPSEAENLILQATLGCSFNGCTFCSMYASKAFTVRPLDALFAEIDAAAKEWPDARRIFLADGDALTLPTGHLLAILAKLAATFPQLNRVSAYATPTNLLKKGPAELAELRAAKLSLVYLGIESGDAEVLRRIAKGATPAGIAEGIDKARAAGMKVSATVILGLGGRELWRQHAAGTAALINAAPPNFLSTLQLGLRPDAEPRFRARFGVFTPQDDDGCLEELAAMVAAMNPPRPVIFRSNHASNALALAGTLPRDRDALLAAIDGARTGRRAVRPRWLRGF
ncbi:MAG: radical SAM protein [Rhodospirillales bacterium]|nr:radical SAM protein [Rhodospirillales bacterium]